MLTLKAALRQAYGDLRPQILGPGILAMIIPSVLILLLFNNKADDIEANNLASLIVAGLIGSFSTLVVMQVGAEYYADRIGGALLRVRILPNGPLVWGIGKAISTIAAMFFMQAVLIFGSIFLLPSFPMTWSNVWLMLGIALLADVASAPLGFILGALVRGTYTQLAAYAAVIALLATSGFAVSITSLWRWLQILQSALPFYWAGQLSRYVAGMSGDFELGNAFNIPLALSILAAWIIVGFALVPFIMRYSFRKESIGSLARIQSTTRSQMGI